MSDEMVKAIIRWRIQQEDLTNARLYSGEISQEERHQEFELIGKMAEKAQEQREEALGLGDESHLADYIVVLEQRVAYLEDMVKQLVEREYGPSYRLDNWKPPESRPFWLFLQ